jgi:hypothetical protein
MPSSGPCCDDLLKWTLCDGHSGRSVLCVSKNAVEATTVGPRSRMALRNRYPTFSCDALWPSLWPFVPFVFQKHSRSDQDRCTKSFSAPETRTHSQMRCFATAFAIFAFFAFQKAPLKLPQPIHEVVCRFGTEVPLSVATLCGRLCGPSCPSCFKNRSSRHHRRSTRLLTAVQRRTRVQLITVPCPQSTARANLHNAAAPLRTGS